MSNKSPQLILAAVPIGGSRVKQFRDDGPDGARRLLEDPPTFRWAGFDLKTLDTAVLVDEDRLEVHNGTRKVLELHQNGLLIARLAADASFLGWGMEPERFALYPRLNPLACVEAHASFVHLFCGVLDRLATRPPLVRMHQALRNTRQQSGYIFLTPFYPGSGIVIDPKIYPAQLENADADHTFPLERVASEPNRVVGELVKSFAQFFDMPAADLPYVKHEGSGLVFDEAGLREA